nr:ATP-dependent RNA helicase SUPV3L1, mitochondrial-like [Meriones unguiculatus]
MSLPRCALLWARLLAGRGAGPQTAASSALRALVGPFPRALGRAPCLAASSSASRGSKAPNKSLFVPLTVKSLGPSADGDVGAELTRPLDKNINVNTRLKLIKASLPKVVSSQVPEMKKNTLASVSG